MRQNEEVYRMILPESLADVTAAESEDATTARLVDADAAAARTRADYGRVSRWLLGLLGTAGAVIAVGLLGFAVSLMTAGAGGAADPLFGGVALFIAAAFAVPSAWLLLRLHRSGRRLASAAGYWAALPYRQGRRAPTRGDWFTVRFAGYSVDLFLRLISSALAGLAFVCAGSLAVRAVVIGEPVWEAVMWWGWTALFAAVCVGQFGGVQRIQNGYLPRDPALRS